MIPSPIHKVLSAMQMERVQHLLMGGQACVLYGAAEFSRDTDLVILAEPGNLDRLRAALCALGATVVAVPPFDAGYLERGHAIHFRCTHPDALGIRIDVMALLRGVDPFPSLWARRTTLELPATPGAAAPAVTIDVLALPDLVAAKKTQRDKDWPMIRRLVETNYLGFRAEATSARVEFWLRELRTPELLMECVAAFPEEARLPTPVREAVIAATSQDARAVQAALMAEEALERERDRVYWIPLRAELEQLRQTARPRDHDM